jgi:polysaccharide biosynthesis transport protein
MTSLTPHNERNGKPHFAVAPMAGNGSGAPQPAESPLEIRELLAILRRQARIVVAAVLVTTALAVLYVMRQEPSYRATAAILLKNERRALTGALAMPASEQVMGYGADPLMTQLQLLQSRTVSLEVVRRTGLRLAPLTADFRPTMLATPSVADEARPDTLAFRFAEDGFTVNSRAGQTRAAYGMPVQHGSVSFTIPAQPDEEEARVAVVTEEAALERFRRAFRASPVDRTDVVEVSFTSTDPALAQLVANTAVEVFQETSAAEAQRESRRKRIFLEEQLSSTDGALISAQDALSAFRRREEVFSSRERFVAQQAGVLDLQLRREELESERRIYTTLLGSLRRAGETGDSGLEALFAAPGIASNEVVQQMYAQLVRYRAARDSLTSGRWSASAQHPEVQRLDALIANTQRTLIAAAQTQVEAVSVRIRALDELRGRTAAEMQALPDKEAEELRLNQQVETIRRMGDLLREEYQKALIDEAVEIGQVDIIDRASLPPFPVGAGKIMIVLLAAFLGLLAGSAGGFMREHLSTTISRTDEIEPLLGLPVLALIPPISTVTTRTRGLSLRSPVGDRNTAVVQSQNSLVSTSDGWSAGAEAYRTLRTHLIFSQADRTIRTLMITSTAPGEGKTTTAANLAVAYAQQGARVILVDADLRKPRLHSMFGLERTPGLAEAVAGFAEVNDVIRPSGIDNLSVITCGTFLPNPSELLGSGRIHRLVKQLAAEADLILIDSPPVLVAGDALIVSTMVDAVLLVVQAGATDRDASVAAVRQLNDVGAHVLGTVVNDPSGTVQRYEARYAYSYRYYGEVGS